MSARSKTALHAAHLLGADTSVKDDRRSRDPRERGSEPNHALTRLLKELLLPAMTSAPAAMTMPTMAETAPLLEALESPGADWSSWRKSCSLARAAASSFEPLPTCVVSTDVGGVS